MKEIEINQYWTKLDVGCGNVIVLKNQNLQLQMETEHGDAYIDISKTEAKQISNMLLVSIGELDESELNVQQTANLRNEF